jgi:hypothetical protein
MQLPSFARLDSPFDFAQGRLGRLSLHEHSWAVWRAVHWRKGFWLPTFVARGAGCSYNFWDCHPSMPGFVRFEDRVQIDDSQVKFTLKVPRVAGEGACATFGD